MKKIIFLLITLIYCGFSENNSNIDNFLKTPYNLKLLKNIQHTVKNKTTYEMLSFATTQVFDKQAKKEIITNLFNPNIKANKTKRGWQKRYNKILKHYQDFNINYQSVYLYSLLPNFHKKEVDYLSKIKQHKGKTNLKNFYKNLYYKMFYLAIHNKCNAINNLNPYIYEKIKEKTSKNILRISKNNQRDIHGSYFYFPYIFTIKSFCSYDADIQESFLKKAIEISNNKYKIYNTLSILYYYNSNFKKSYDYLRRIKTKENIEYINRELFKLAYINAIIATKEKRTISAWYLSKESLELGLKLKNKSNLMKYILFSKKLLKQNAIKYAKELVDKNSIEYAKHILEISNNLFSKKIIK